jgi:hypothetical protein
MSVFVQPSTFKCSWPFTRIANFTISGRRMSGWSVARVPSASMTMPRSWQHWGAPRVDATACPLRLNFAQGEASKLWREPHSKYLCFLRLNDTKACSSAPSVCDGLSFGEQYLSRLERASELRPMGAGGGVAGSTRRGGATRAAPQDAISGLSGNCACQGQNPVTHARERPKSFV